MDWIDKIGFSRFKKSFMLKGIKKIHAFLFIKVILLIIRVRMHMI